MEEVKCMFFLQADAAGQTAAGGGVLGLFLPFLIVGVLFYFMIIRPQQKQQKERKAMLDALKKAIELLQWAASMVRSQRSKKTM